MLRALRGQRRRARARRRDGRDRRRAAPVRGRELRPRARPRRAPPHPRPRPRPRPSSCVSCKPGGTVVFCGEPSRLRRSARRPAEARGHRRRPDLAPGRRRRPSAAPATAPTPTTATRSSPRSTSTPSSRGGSGEIFGGAGFDRRPDPRRGAARQPLRLVAAHGRVDRRAGRDPPPLAPLRLPQLPRPAEGRQRAAGAAPAAGALLQPRLLGAQAGSDGYTEGERVAGDARGELERQRVAAGPRQVDERGRGAGRTTVDDAVADVVPGVASGIGLPSSSTRDRRGAARRAEDEEDPPGAERRSSAAPRAGGRVLVGDLPGAAVGELVRRQRGRARRRSPGRRAGSAR